MSTSTLPISSIAALSPTSVTPSSSAVTSAANAPSQSTNLASQNVFLQLLVAQLKNQDPEQPTDGTAFVTELAQFTTLQEDSQSATDLNTIVSALPALEPAAAGTAATGSATTSGTNNTTN